MSLELCDYKFVFGSGFLNEINKAFKDDEGNPAGVVQLVNGLATYDTTVLLLALNLASKGTGKRFLLENPDEDFEKFLKEVNDCAEPSTREEIDAYNEKIFDVVLEEVLNSNFIGAQASAHLKKVKIALDVEMAQLQAAQTAKNLFEDQLAEIQTTTAQEPSLKVLKD